MTDRRSRPSSRVASSMLFLVLLVWLVPGVASADYKDSFKAGVTAYEKKNYEEAVRHMQEAVRQNPRSGGPTIKIYGTKMEQYVPYYYLGMAQYRLGDLDAARASLERAKDEFVVARVKRMRRALDATLDDIAKRSPKVAEQQAPPTRRTERRTTPTSATSNAALEDAKSKAARAVAVASGQRQAAAELVSRAEQLGVLSSDPSLRQRWDAAVEELNAAVRQARSVGDVASAQALEAGAQRLAGELQDLQSAVGTLVERAEAARSEALAQQRRRSEQELAQLAIVIGEAKDVLAESLSTDASSALRSARQRLTSSMAQAERLGAGSSAGEIEAAAGSLSRHIRTLRAEMRSAVPAEEEALPVLPETGTPGVAEVSGPEIGATSPPGALRRAAGLFFQGDSAGALHLLQGADFEDSRARLQVALFRAAALFRQYVAAGESDPALLRETRDEIARCREISPGFRPSAAYFSPAFVDLFVGSAGP